MEVAVVASLSEDDGYVSPEYEFSDDSVDDEEDLPPTKRSKTSKQDDKRGRTNENTIEDDEELALQLLRKP